mgnify:FL=1
MDLNNAPTGSLDSKNTKMILDLLRKMADEGKCVIVVSHSDNIKQYADEILYIENNKLSKKSGDLK